MLSVVHVRGLLLAAFVAAFGLSAFCDINSASAQDEKLLKLLSIKPRQKDVRFDTPSRQAAAKCEVKNSKEPRGYIVVDANDRVLRRFVDTNKDDRLDQWSYYKDGIEVYRDIDSNYDNKADQYRWMGSLGTRWGIDKNQDGKIDSWRSISAEEVAEETFYAIRSGSPERFSRILISREEIASLGLGPKMTEVVSKSADAARKSFGTFIQRQRTVNGKSQWVHFGTSQPNLIPAGNDGLKQDVVVYDHASAVFRNGKDYEQIAIGTIFKLADGSWRLSELPHIVVEGKAVANGGIMFPMPDFSAQAGIQSNISEQDKEFAKLYNQLDKLKESARKAKSKVDVIRFEKQMADVRKELVSASRKEDQKNWIESLADTVSDAVQRGRFPDGLVYLDEYYRELDKKGIKSGRDYIQWRTLNTRFSQAIEKGDRRQRTEANSDYIDDLVDFVKYHPGSQFAPEALNNLGMHFENSDRQNPERAIEFYKRCAKQFPNTGYGRKANGAVQRLSSIGKKINFRGKTVDGRTFDLNSQSGGKIIIIHFWESGNEFCIKDFEIFKRLSEKYKEDLLVIGANVDYETATFKKFMARNRLGWTQLHEPGGVEKSSLAHQMGPSTLPLILLIDGDKTLVESGIPADELEREIQRQIRRSAKK